MIALDTNVLLRALLNDDPIQSPTAQKLLRSLNASRPGLVNIPVLMELFWTLRSRHKLPQAGLAQAVRGLLEAEHLRFEALEAVGEALAAYETGVAEFADAVIALRNRELGADKTYTFDRDAAARIPAMELLA